MDSMLEVTDIPYRNGKKRLMVQTAVMLDDLLNDSDCPVFLHNELFGKVTWQKRSEFSISHVLAVPSLAPQFAGALLTWGTSCILEDDSEQLLEAVLAEPGGSNRIHSLIMPLEIPGRVWAEARTGSTPNDWPIVWALAVIDLQASLVQDARIALSGVWSQSVALAQAADGMAGSPMTETMIRQITDAVMAEVTPRGDYRGSVEYRKSMAGVMTCRALQACLEGAAA